MIFIPIFISQICLPRLKCITDLYHVDPIDCFISMTELDMLHTATLDICIYLFSLVVSSVNVDTAELFIKVDKATISTKSWKS